METKKISLIEKVTDACVRYAVPVAGTAISGTLYACIAKAVQGDYPKEVVIPLSVFGFAFATAGTLGSLYGVKKTYQRQQRIDQERQATSERIDNEYEQRIANLTIENNKKIEALEEKVLAQQVAPKAIYQFETQPMTVEAADARVANINCILESYQTNVTSKNFAAYATRKTQVEMKNLLDKKNLLVEPEQFIAGVISIANVEYAEQVKNTIEAIIPMAKSALTYEGKAIGAKAESETATTQTQ
jgi:hypothetical protein